MPILGYMLGIQAQFCFPNIAMIQSVNKSILLICTLLLISSCSKDGSNHFQLDKIINITIQAGADTYSTYGYTNTQVSSMFGGPEISITNNPDSTGAAQTQVLFVATDQITSGVNTVEFIMGNCTADWYMSKSGSQVIGQYINLPGTQTSNTFTINNNAKQYWLYKKPFIFSITKQDTHNGRPTLEGSFSVTLRLSTDTSVTQSASGTFRAYIRQ